MKKNNLFIAAIIFVLVFVFHSLISFDPRSANDFPYLSQSELEQRFSIPYAWWNRGSQGLGEYSIPFLWVWPMDFIYGFFANLGFPFWFIERYLGIIPAFALGIYSIRKLLKSYNLSESAIFVGTLVYLFNTYVLLLLDGGQIAFVFSYALLPLVFLHAVYAFENNSIRGSVPFVALTGLLTFFDIRYIYILVLLIGMYVIYTLLLLPKTQYVGFLQNWTRIGIFSGLFLVGLLSYMLLPAFLASGVALPEGYDRVSQTNFLGFTTMANAILLLQPHWYKNTFGQLTPLLWYFTVFPILSFSAPLLNKKNKIVGFWLLVALLGIFLTKGSLEPLGEIYTWAFTYIPGFSLFRDSSKFYVFVALSYAVLSSFTVSVLQEKYMKRNTIVPVFVTLFFLTVTLPVWLGKMTGMFSRQPYLTEFNQIQQFLADDTSFGRVLWIPGRTPLSYADQNHYALEASRLVGIRPFGIGVVGNYEIFNFLRDAPFMDQLFIIAAVSYVSYPYPDERREELKEDNKKYYETFLTQLTNAEWADKKLTEKPFPLIKTKSQGEHAFLSTNHFFIVGSDRIYWDLSEIEGFDLSKNALTFVEESIGLSNSVDRFTESQILEYKTGIYDLPASFIAKNDIHFLASDLSFDPNERGWWKRESSDLIWWRAFLQEKYSIDSLDFDYEGGWAIAEGNRELKVENGQIKQGNILLARAMTSSKGGKIEYYQGGTKIGEVATKTENPETITLVTHGLNDVPDTILEYDDGKVRWDEVGVFVSDEPLTIRTEGELNVINALSFIPEDIWNEHQRKAAELRLSGRAQRFEDIAQSAKEALFLATAPGSITYKRISPVHYKVVAEGITRPQTIILSESFNSMWEMNGQESLKMYSFLNGFRVNENGEYDVYFTAQRYVNIGLVMSVTTLLLLLFLIFKYQEEK